MNAASYYRWNEAFTRGAVRVTQPEDIVQEHDIDLALGKWAPPRRIAFEQYEGTKLLDLVGTQWAPLRLISARVRRAFAAAGVSGWRTVEVDLRTPEGEAIRGYALLIITGRCGRIDNTRSVQVKREIVGNPRGALVWRGMYFDERTWDGSDVFAPEGTAFAFATDKAKQTLDEIRATNIEIVALQDVERLSLR
jgi:hypothetical protein